MSRILFVGLSVPCFDALVSISINFIYTFIFL